MEVEDENKGCNDDEEDEENYEVFVPHGGSNMTMTITTTMTTKTTTTTTTTTMVKDLLPI